MNRADPLIDVIASQQNPVTDVIVNSVEQRSEGTTTSLAEPMPRMIGTAGARRQASPVRLTLASRLGNEIDGAWWPRTELISRELPELVSILEIRLGQIIDINVNWSPLQGPPNLNWDGWQGVHQHVMAVGGRDARANVLIVPYRTGTALAVMVLRRPIYPVHRDSRAFQTAEAIVRVARGENAAEASNHAVAQPLSTVRCRIPQRMETSWSIESRGNSRSTTAVTTSWFSVTAPL
ncbi:DUF5994 family protein [Mycobacterium malmoense]|uniref:DUF5994 family protein n=1 Tax=Mycobacterium malmoense TaxID=1780 RepID=UPI0015A518B4